MGLVIDYEEWVEMMKHIYHLPMTARGGRRFDVHVDIRREEAILYEDVYVHVDIRREEAILYEDVYVHVDIRREEAILLK